MSDDFKGFYETLDRAYGAHNQTVNPDVIDPDGTERIAVGYGSSRVYMTAAEFHEHCNKNWKGWTPPAPKSKNWTFDPASVGCEPTQAGKDKNGVYVYEVQDDEPSDLGAKIGVVLLIAFAILMIVAAVVGLLGLVAAG